MAASAAIIRYFIDPGHGSWTHKDCTPRSDPHPVSVSPDPDIEFTTNLTLINHLFSIPVSPYPDIDFTINLIISHYPVSPYPDIDFTISLTLFNHLIISARLPVLALVPDRIRIRF